MALTEDEIRIAVMKADLVLKNRQASWEIPKAVAMVVIAGAAIAAAGGLAGWIWPTRPQQIVIHFDQPLSVKLQDK